MSHILDRVRDVDANNSEAVKEAVTAFFQNLLKYKSIDCNQWLRTLENVINRFPKFCGVHRTTIETYVGHFLLSNNYFSVVEAAKCAHAMQQVRPVQEKASTVKYCWSEQMIALCDTAHRLIDTLFTRNADVYITRNTQKDGKQVLANSTLHEVFAEIESLAGEENVDDRTTVLSTRLRNVLIFIQAMLVEIYPVAKPIEPKLVLAVILQALTAPVNQDSSNTTTIKIQALRTLDALIECLGSNLIPFSALVFRFVMQTLKCSSENLSKETSKVRIAAYSSLSKWLDCLHVYRPSVDGQARAWQDELTAHIISDVKPVKHVMQLTPNAHPMANLSRKERKRLANAMLRDSIIASLMPGVKDKNNLSDKTTDEVAVAALECAETFLLVCGIFVKTTIHKEFQEFLVRECFTIQDHGADRAICLLRALEACRKSCSVKIPPPTQYCLHLYSVLINSPEREISKFCSQALLDIRMHLHCSPPSLSFTLEEQSLIKKKKEEGRKRASEKNRAVLERLIGIDWMNPEDPNAVITIPDEPTAKRSRESIEVVSEVTENVSISSDSIDSVDLDTDSDDESISQNEPIHDPIHELIDDDVVLYVPLEQDANSGDSGIHNEPIQFRSREPQGVSDEPPIDNVDSLEPTQDSIDLEIHDEPTQVSSTINVEDVTDKVTENTDQEVEQIMDTTNSQIDIHNAKTQLPNSDTIDGKSPLSMEVAYDYPNTGNEKVTVLEKMDDENLPSTNDTDDIQITCGQLVKSSQDLEAEKGKDEIVEEIRKEVPTVNGIGKSMDNENTAKDNDASQTAPNDKAITVEDMLADFVDEVIEE